MKKLEKLYARLNELKAYPPTRQEQEEGTVWEDWEVAIEDINDQIKTEKARLRKKLKKVI